MKVFYCSTCFECYYIHPQESATLCRCIVLFRCVLVYWCTPKQNNTPTNSRRLLRMNVITFETCWAIKNFHKVTSSWFNLFNIRLYLTTRTLFSETLSVVQLHWQRVSFHTAPKLPRLMTTAGLCAEGDLHSGGMGKSDSPVSWSHPDSPKPVTRSRNNCIKIKTGDYKMSKCRTSRFATVWNCTEHETGINAFRPNCMPRGYNYTSHVRAVRLVCGE